VFLRKVVAPIGAANRGSFYAATHIKKELTTS